MVGRTRFELVKAMPVDLQSTPFGHSGTYPFLDIIVVPARAGSAVIGWLPEVGKGLSGKNLQPDKVESEANPKRNCQQAEHRCSDHHLQRR